MAASASRARNSATGFEPAMRHGSANQAIAHRLASTTPHRKMTFSSFGFFAGAADASPIGAVRSVPQYGQTSLA